MYKEMIEQAALKGHDDGLGKLLEQYLKFHDYDEHEYNPEKNPLKSIITPQLLAKVLMRIESKDDPRLNIFSTFASNGKSSFVTENKKLESCAWQLFSSPAHVEEHLDRPIEWHIKEKGLYSLLEGNEYSPSPIAVYLNAKEIKKLVNNGEEQLAIKTLNQHLGGISGMMYLYHLTSEYFAHCLQKNHWDMAALLFEKSIPFPTKENSAFTEDFMAFVEKNNICQIQETERYKRLKQTMEGGYDAIKGLKENLDIYQMVTPFMTIERHDKLYLVTQIIRKLDKMQKPPEQTDPTAFENTKQTLKTLLSQFLIVPPDMGDYVEYSNEVLKSLNKTIDGDFVDWAIMNGFSNLLKMPVIRTLLDAPGSEYKTRALAETAFINYAENEAGFTLLNLNVLTPEENPKPLSANCLAALLSRNEIYDAIRLINTTDVSLDLPKALFKGMPKGLEKGIVQWAKDTNNTLLITSCPRVKALTASKSKSILHAHSKVTNPSSFGKRKEKEDEKTPEAKKPKRM